MYVQLSEIHPVIEINTVMVEGLFLKSQYYRDNMWCGFVITVGLFSGIRVQLGLGLLNLLGLMRFI